MYLERRQISPFSKNFVDNNSFNGQTNCIAIQSDGKSIIAGTFTAYNAITGRDRLIRLNADGSTDTAFCANASDGSKFNAEINAIEVQSDGKILVGGFFTSYGGTATRDYFIRLNADGTLDTTFCVNATDGTKFSNRVKAIAVRSDGSILVGGAFTSYPGVGGQRSKLVQLLSTGVVDETGFNSAASDGGKFNATVEKIVIQSDGNILVGGTFTSYNTVFNRSYLVRLTSAGALDTAFCNNAVDGGKFGSTVYDIAVQSDGAILVGGVFLSYPGTPTPTNRNYLIRLSSAGVVDNTFCVNATDGGKFSSTVYSITLQTDGSILVGGDFTSYPGATNRNRLIKLSSNGVVDSAFCINASDGAKFTSIVYKVAVQSDGAILVGGSFVNYAGTPNRSILIRMLSSGIVDVPFCINSSDGRKFGGVVSCIVVQPDGKILIGGGISNYGGTTGRNGLVRLNADGTLDTAFCANASDGAKFVGSVSAIALQSNGAILVGGAFTGYPGTSSPVNRSRLIRLSSAGVVDETFCINASDGAKFSNTVTTIAVQSDGAILVGGAFTVYPGTPTPTNRNRLIRLLSTGVVDNAFCVNASDNLRFSAGVNKVVVQSDGAILVGGSFINYGAPATTGRNYLIRLLTNGTTDTTFCALASDGPKFSAAVNDIVVQSDGAILVGGLFVNYGAPATTGRNYLIRLLSTGNIDAAFCINASDSAKFAAAVSTINVQTDGLIILGGSFSAYAGIANRNRLIRLNSNGTLNTQFCINASDGNRVNNTVNCTAIKSDGTILIGGSFTNYKITNLSLVRFTSFVPIRTDGILK